MPSPWGSDEPDGWKGEAWTNGVAALVGAIALPCIAFFGLDVEASVVRVIGVAVLGAVIGAVLVNEGPSLL